MSSVEKMFNNPLMPYSVFSCGLKYDMRISFRDKYILSAVEFHSKGIPTKFDDEYLSIVGNCSLKQVGVSLNKLKKFGYIMCDGPLTQRWIYTTKTIIQEISEKYEKEYLEKLQEKYYLALRDRANIFLLSCQFNRKEAEKNSVKKDKKTELAEKNSEETEKNRPSKIPESATEADLSETESPLSYKESFNKDNFIILEEKEGVLTNTFSDSSESHSEDNESFKTKERMSTKELTEAFRKLHDKLYSSNYVPEEDEYIDPYEYSEEEEAELNKVDFKEVFPNGHNPDDNNIEKKNIPYKENSLPASSSTKETNRPLKEGLDIPDPVALEKCRVGWEIHMSACAARGDWATVNKLNAQYERHFGKKFSPSKEDMAPYLEPKKERKKKEGKKGGLVVSENPEDRRERMKQAARAEAAKQETKLNREAGFVMNYWKRAGFPEVKEKYEEYTIDLIKMFLTGKFSDKIPSFKGREEDRPYSHNEIIIGIQNRKLKAFDSEYWPTEDVKKKMRRMTLSSWLLIPGKEKDPSTFIRDFYKEPKKVTASVGMIDDVNPVFTSLVKQIFAKEVINMPVNKWSNTDENKFRLATKRFEEFKYEHRNRLDNLILYPVSQEKVARLFVKSAIYGANGEAYKLSPGWLCSDQQFNIRLPKFLNDKGFLFS